MNEETIRAIKGVTDASAMGIAFATLFKWLPIIAAGLSIAWYIWRFWKEFTGRGKDDQLGPPKAGPDS